MVIWQRGGGSWIGVPELSCLIVDSGARSIFVERVRMTQERNSNTEEYGVASSPFSSAGVAASCGTYTVHCNCLLLCCPVCKTPKDHHCVSLFHPSFFCESIEFGIWQTKNTHLLKKYYFSCVGRLFLVAISI